MISFRKNHIRNIGWQGFGTGMAQIVNLISLPIITRLYLPSDIGLLKVFLEALAFFAIIISLKVEHIVLLPKKDKNAKKLLLLVLSLGLLSSTFTTLFILLAYFFGVLSFNLLMWTILLPFTSYLMVYSRAIQQFSQRSANFKRSGISEIINRTVNSGFAIFSGILFKTNFNLLIAVGCGFVFKIITLHHAYKLNGFYPINHIKDGVKYLLEKGYQKILSSLIFSQIALSITTLSPLWYISHRWGAEDLGYYALVLSTLVLPTTIIGRAVGQVFYQQASSVFANGSSFKEIFLSNISLLLVIGFCSFPFIYLFAENLYPFIFGSAWLKAGIIAKYYVFASLISFISIPFERSSIIVNAWWYSPVWYIGRIVTTFGVIFYSHIYETEFLDFIFFLSIQIGIMHFIDILASYLFSIKKYRFTF
jgi:O-antigen/teichoic acid export membrane protein